MSLLQPKYLAAKYQRSLGNAGFLTAILARRHIVLGPEHAPKVGWAVDRGIESNRRYRAPALGSGLQCPRAGLEPAAQDVAGHGLVLIREQVMQITSGHLAGLGDARRSQIRIVQMCFDEIDDADAVRRRERGSIGQGLRQTRVRGADEIEDGHCDTAAGLFVEPLVVLIPAVAEELRQQAAGSPDARHRNGSETLGATDLTPEGRVRYPEDQHAVRAGEYHVIATGAVAEREVAGAQHGLAPVLTTDALALELQMQKEHRVLRARHVRT